MGATMTRYMSSRNLSVDRSKIVGDVTGPVRCFSTAISANYIAVRQTGAHFEREAKSGGAIQASVFLAK